MKIEKDKILIYKRKDNFLPLLFLGLDAYCIVCCVLFIFLGISENEKNLPSLFWGISAFLSIIFVWLLWLISKNTKQEEIVEVGRDYIEFFEKKKSSKYTLEQIKSIYKFSEDKLFNTAKCAVEIIDGSEEITKYIPASKGNINELIYIIDKIKENEKDYKSLEEIKDQYIENLKEIDIGYLIKKGEEVDLAFAGYDIRVITEIVGGPYAPRAVRIPVYMFFFTKPNGQIVCVKKKEIKSFDIEILELNKIYTIKRVTKSEFLVQKTEKANTNFKNRLESDETIKTNIDDLKKIYTSNLKEKNKYAIKLCIYAFMGILYLIFISLLNIKGADRVFKILTPIYVLILIMSIISIRHLYKDNKYIKALKKL